MTTVAVGHVLVDDQGVARLEGSRIKVMDLVMEKSANNWTAEEIQRQFPHLSLAQVYAAFAYYYSHQDEVDRQIQASLQHADRARTEAGESEIVRRLLHAGKLN
jgi:uncharacterized protein (DUF433 family)